jgi:hypothetical protein
MSSIVISNPNIKYGNKWQQSKRIKSMLMFFPTFFYFYLYF